MHKGINSWTDEYDLISNTLNIWIQSDKRVEIYSNSYMTLIILQVTSATVFTNI